MDPKHSDEHLEKLESLDHAKDAHLAADGTRNWGVKKSLGVWSPAVFYCMAISIAIIWESYATVLLNSYYVLPAFTRHYGVEVEGSPGSYVIPSQIQVAINAGTTGSIILGIFLGAPVIDRYGARFTLFCGTLITTGFIFLTFFAHNIWMILAGALLTAMPWGSFSVLCPLYAVELCPVQLRSYLVSWVNLCWVIGHVIASGVQRGFVNNSTQWAYRIPFALEWVPVPFVLLAAVLAPDSPYYLVRRGHDDRALQSLARLHKPHEAIDDAKILAEIKETIRVEKELKTGGAWSSCFNKRNLRRTEIAVIGWTSQGLVGFVIQFYTTYFFVRAGLSTEQAFGLGLGTYCIALVGTISSWFLQRYLGRRTIQLVGFAYMGTTMLCVACLTYATTETGQWAQAILLLVWFYGYGSTSGPIAYVIASEAPAIMLRAKTMSIARNVYYVVLLLAQILAPYFLEGWNLQGASAFPAAIFTWILLVWAWFRLPELKGRSFAELDILFTKNVPARKFKSYVITEEERKDFHDVYGENK